MQKTIQNFAAAIDLAKSKVRHGPQKITLFGGNTTNGDGKPLSQRGTFLLLYPGDLADAFVVPENFKNWNHFGVYDDLLSFEEDVCALVDSVVVFLESPGAIAEFGALIKNKDIAPKLFVVVNKEFEEDSFIGYGLVKYLTHNYSKTVNFISSQSSELLKEEAHFIINEMKERFKKIPKTEKFTKSITRHIFYTIIDFVDLLQVARISDIQLFLTELKIQIPKKRLEQLLLALKNVDALEESKVLNERCFTVKSSAIPSIEYSFLPGTTSKRMSWKAIMFSKTMEDKWRAFAYKVLKVDAAEKKNVA
ncbi:MULTISPECIES: retron St85 family effector protein [unclassified Duganella]|uniref:retron St85 family effector protein n=1 Tax=unclassified Duganella TaxID=2636909 RepID=UPI00088BF9A8|nr:MULTISPECIES: retron St85 family effector protein [unclassified Duganella]SDH43820.1 hypothetical protein SAMN05216320_11391 [Duganella sp. OV458]SDK58668.1 hypothetical protein SAMN05428973_11371 [Duganella sp. OV510]